MLAEHLVGLKSDWKALVDNTNNDIKVAVQTVVEAHCETLAESFYEAMLSHPEGKKFLSHEVVQTRLSSSLQQWLSHLFLTTHDDEAINRLIEQQIIVGEVHGKIDVPVHLVSRGGRMLKAGFRQHSSSVAAYLYFSNMVDIALEVMSVAYHKNYQRNTREEEAYRLFSVTQDIGREKEAQRAALLNWENEILFEHATGSGHQRLSRLEQSEFGLWFRHKGLHAFEGALECGQVMEQMARIDDHIVPQLERRQSNILDAIHELRGTLRNLVFLLDSLFERSEKLESGKDSLTRLLNRKFLPAVMNRQLTIARQRNERYALLVIDVDHFKRINDTYGHAHGDKVLQQVALTITNTVRSGDYTFRLGGEEFMVLLVDVDDATADKVAEKIRSAIAKDIFQLTAETQVQVTISIGSALYSGHPDYQYDLNCADKALYHAKKNGRNQVAHWRSLAQS